jgi:hypothetical protein
MKSKSRSLLFLIPLIFIFFVSKLFALDFLRIDQIKVGDSGYGLSVFKGHKIEKFYFKINGIEDSDNGGIEYLIAVWKESNGSKEPISLVGGMSGSPLYINGKLAAVVRSTYYSNEGTAIPFQYMYEEAKRSLHFRSLYRGIPDSRKYIPAQRKLQPGSSIKIGFIVSDDGFSEYAMGTVTAVDENGIVYALGHTLKNALINDPEGPVSYTAWEGEVAGTVSSTNSKIPGVDKDKGQVARIWYNGLFGVYGSIDEVSQMVPVYLILNAPSFNSYKNVSIQVPYAKYLPILIQVAERKFVTNYIEPFGEVTIDFEGLISVEGRNLQIKERFSRLSTELTSVAKKIEQKTYFFGSLARIISFDSRVNFSEISMNFNVKPVGPVLSVSKVKLIKSQVRPGEKVGVAIQLTQKNGSRYEPIVSCQVPKYSQTIGKVIIETGDSFVYREDTTPPTNIDELIEDINRESKSNDSLYITFLLLKNIKEIESEENSLLSGDWHNWWKKPDKTVFRQPWEILKVERLTPPDDATVISDFKDGRHEFTFKVVSLSPGYDLLRDIFVDFLIILGIIFGFWLSLFVFVKIFPYLDRGFALLFIKKRKKHHIHKKKR